MTDRNPTHCAGCAGWIEPEYLRREPCPGAAALSTTPALTLCFVPNCTEPGHVQRVHAPENRIDSVWQEATR